MCFLPLKWNERKDKSRKSEAATLALCAGKQTSLAPKMMMSRIAGTSESHLNFRCPVPLPYRCLIEVVLLQKYTNLLVPVAESPFCHPERSEGSQKGQILRFAQNDN
jgi:hypothetical protein